MYKKPELKEVQKVAVAALGGSCDTLRGQGVVLK